MTFRKFLFHIIRGVLRIFARVRAEGVQSVPLQGGAMLAVNHLSRLDAPLIFIHIDRQDLTGIVANKYKSYPFIRWLVNIVNGIWIDRENPEPRAIREAIQFLHNGGMLGIAPEGTRSKEACLIEGKMGVAYLATKANVPIIPVGIWGTETGAIKMLTLQRPFLNIRFGTAFTLPPLNRVTRDADLKHNSDEIMCQIAALLPEQYQGVYQGNPRILEIQTAQEHAKEA